MKTSKRIIALLMALTMSLSMFSSTVWASEEDHTSEGSDSSISVVEENPTTVSVSKSTLTLFTGKSATLKATVQPEGEHTVQWSSDNKKVATVDSMGKVTAKGAGNCTITATVDDVTATCAVTVKKPTIKLNKASLSVDVKKTATLKATVDGPNKKVTWKSSNKKTATVDKNGKVTAKKAGKCTITATANGVSAICKVKVRSEKEAAIEAYREFLSQDTIKWWGDDSSYESGAYSFALIYIDKDSIPELALFNELSSSAGGKYAIYSYSDGAPDKLNRFDYRSGIKYYKKKGVAISLRWGFGYQYTWYNLFSSKKDKAWLQLAENDGQGIKGYYSYKADKWKEIKKSSFQKQLKSKVGSSKPKVPKYHKNSKANREKYLK